MSKKNNYLNPNLERKVRYRYVPVRQTLSSDEIGTYTTFGISAYDMEQQIAFVSDVSTDCEQVRRLADRLTREQLDPIHLHDVIEDFLADASLILA